MLNHQRKHTLLERKCLDQFFINVKFYPIWTSIISSFLPVKRPLNSLTEKCLKQEQGSRHRYTLTNTVWILSPPRLNYDIFLPKNTRRISIQWVGSGINSTCHCNVHIYIYKQQAALYNFVYGCSNSGCTKFGNPKKKWKTTNANQSKQKIDRNGNFFSKNGKKWAISIATTVDSETVVSSKYIVLLYLLIMKSFCTFPLCSCLCY